MIGPFRGGRTVAVAGVPQRPGTFYMAPNNGGVWKSNDYARTWQPIFDGQDTGSVGALAVAPSDPNVVYVGSGEGLRRPDLSTGDGIYKSTDAGATWTHLGLRDGQQIQAIAVDPRDPNRLFVAVVGHPFGPTPNAACIARRDGGATFAKVLGHGDDLGAVEVDDRPEPSRHRLRRHVGVAQRPVEPNPSLHAIRRRRSVQVDRRRNDVDQVGDGFPGENRTHRHRGLAGAIRSASTRSSKSRRGCGVYRSDDAGASWVRTNDEERVCGRTEDFAGITADPKNAT